MHPVTQLVCYGLRQAVGLGTDDAVRFINQHFTDHSRALPEALAKANDRAWQALAVALAGDGWLTSLRTFFASGDAKGIRDQVARFLNSGRLGFEGTPVQFRQKCLAELQALRKSGLLSAERLDVRTVVEQARHFARYGDAPALVAGAWQAVHGVADALAEGYPNLARLLRQPATGEPPLLAAAFAYFFRREVAKNDELARSLFWDGLRQLSAAQEAAFGDVGQALEALGGRFDQLLEQLAERLGRIEAGVAEVHGVTVATHGAVLDAHAELLRLGDLQLSSAEEVRLLIRDVLARLTRLGMQVGELLPPDSFSIHNEEERQAVKQLLARFRQLPRDEQRQVPALLNALGKLQVGAGDLGGAARTFQEVTREVGDPSGKAEACYNAYRVSLEERKWDEALAAIRQAAELDRKRFEPFPMQRYEPRGILGAGGFGTAFRCHDRFLKGEVVVKVLHPADLDRSTEDVFREAQTLRLLRHPAIIEVLDCNYADPAAPARPYIVMEYFPGVSLGTLVRDRGPLAPPDLVAVARQVAEGIRAAHGQGILHRDLKPDNVLVLKDGDQWRVKIIDFGLALRRGVVERGAVPTSDEQSILGGSVAGTIKYAPPEQTGQLFDDQGRRVPVGPYSDVYAFGKLACYSLFKTTEPKSRHWESSPEYLALKAVLEKCMEEELEHRHADFGQILALLGALTSVGPRPGPVQEVIRDAAPVDARSARLSDLTLPEELYLLLADDDTGGIGLLGTFHPFARYGTQAAALAELVLANRARLRQVGDAGRGTPAFRVEVIDRTPLGNTLLDVALASLTFLASESDPVDFGSRQGLAKLFGQGEDNWQLVIRQLVLNRILGEQRSKVFFSLFTRTKYPILAIDKQLNLRHKFSDAVRAGAPLSARVALLVLVARECTRGADFIFDRAFSQDVKESQRIAAIELAQQNELARLIQQMLIAAFASDDSPVTA